MKFIHRRRGAANYITVLFVTFVAVFVIGIVQTRVMTSIYRMRTLNDDLKSTYIAETQIYDTLIKLVYYSSVSLPYTYGPVTLPDGTQLTIVGDNSGGNDVFTATAERPYAINILQAERVSSVLSGANNLEIALAIDCTGSMDKKADDSCSGGGCPTRMTAQKNAVINFLQSIQVLPEASRVAVGVSVFGRTAQWFTAPNSTGVDQVLSLSNDHARTVEVVQNGLGSTRANSRACCFGGNHRPGCNLDTLGTGIGVGYAFMNDFYAANPPAADTVRTEVLVTDGDPNYRPPAGAYPACPIGVGNTNYNFLRCTLADASTYVPQIAQNGLRNPNNSAYGVTVHSDVSAEVQDIFRTYAGVDNYFTTDNATNLTQILDDILNTVLTGYRVRLKRIVP